MSLLLRGRTVCPLCDNVIGETDEAVLFPAFSWSDQDPLLLFNDAVFHASCFDADPRAGEASHVIAELLANTGPGHRACIVCANQVTDPDDYLLLPRFTDDVSEPLHRFNYTHLHKSHIARWKDRLAALTAIETRLGLEPNSAFLRGLLASLTIEDGE